MASWLTGSTSVPLLASTGVGAAATVAADLIGQHLLAPFQISVGLVAAALGGMYLLLVIGRRSAKERRAAA
ncbi:iron chelate uptake ABC transporter family permease subunit [Sphingomonas sp. LR61]|uniref:iron chelate uptake ABC transporter family permease subunit n=1 Tax=Sphingomonas sp. LR61 TaxID=3050234 RepID=UPI003FA7B7F7